MVSEKDSGYRKNFSLIVTFIVLISLVFILSLFLAYNFSKKNIENIQAKHSFLVETIQGSEIIKLSNARSTKLFNWRNIIAVTDSISHKIQSLNVFSLNRC